MDLREFKLPTWCWLDGNTHKGDLLKAREVLLHTPSMTIVEFICLDEVGFIPNENVLSNKFTFEGQRYIAVVYKSQSTDPNEVINLAIEFFKKDTLWIEKQMIDGN